MVRMSQVDFSKPWKEEDLANDLTSKEEWKTTEKIIKPAWPEEPTGFKASKPTSKQKNKEK